jgi:hypothetical protein
VEAPVILAAGSGLSLGGDGFSSISMNIPRAFLNREAIVELL